MALPADRFELVFRVLEVSLDAGALVRLAPVRVVVALEAVSASVAVRAERTTAVASKRNGVQLVGCGALTGRSSIIVDQKGIQTFRTVHR